MLFFVGLDAFIENDVIKREIHPDVLNKQ